MSLPDVAAQLRISAQTLETRCKNLKDKIHLADDTALVNYALKCKSCFARMGLTLLLLFFIAPCDWNVTSGEYPPSPNRRSPNRHLDFSPNRDNSSYVRIPRFCAAAGHPIGQDFGSIGFGGVFAPERLRLLHTAGDKDGMRSL